MPTSPRIGFLVIGEKITALKVGCLEKCKKIRYRREAVNKEKCCGRPLSPVAGRGSAHFPHFLLPCPQIADPPSFRQGDI